MLDSSDFRFEPYKDSRVVNRPGFAVGMSGPLLIATNKHTGKKYLVKHKFPHNAANEYVACRLAEWMGVPAPKAYLLSPNKLFESKYAVAIEFIDGFRRFSQEDVPEELKPELIAQYALCLMLRLDDAIQLSRTDDHIYSYDFSEGFNIVDMSLILKMGEDAMVSFLRNPLNQFKRSTETEDFDMSFVARGLHIAPEEMKKGVTAAVRRAAAITDDELDELSDELMEMYPVAVAVYYEECVRSIRDKARGL